MANKQQSKYEPKKLTKKELEAKEAKKMKVIKISTTVFAIVALLAIIGGIIAGILVNNNRNKKTSFNYLEEDLNKYVSVDLDKFNNFEVKNNVDRVTDAAVRNELLKLLNTYKPNDALASGTKYNNAPVAPGDDAYIFYRGYTIDEYGNKVDFTGGSNLLPNKSDSNIPTGFYDLYLKNFNMYKNYISPLTIGSGSFINGFELGIVDAFYSEDGVYNGKKPSDFQQYLGYVEEERTTVEAGDYISISYIKHNVTTTDTDEMRTLVTINLADDKLDETYGIEGFASNFVGKTVRGEEFNIMGAKVGEETIDYRNIKVTKVHSTTKSSDLVEISYLPVDSKDRMTAIIDLSNPHLEEIYGVDDLTGKNLGELLVGKPIGEKIGNYIQKGEGDDETDTLYSDVIIERAYHFDDKDPLTITVQFPYNYGSKDLAGKEAKFDVYVIGVKKYYDGFPKFNDDFVTNELKAKAEELADYEGNSISEKYIAMVRSELDKEYEAAVNALIEEEIWNILHEFVTVKQYPESEVNYYYNLYYTQLYSQYQQYQQYYGSSYTFDMFAEAQGLKTKDKKWQQSLTEQAQTTVAEKLAFYYTIKAKNLLPDEATLKVVSDKFREETFADYLEEYGYNAENDENGEKYNQYKEEFDSQYTQAAIEEAALFKYAMEKLYTFAKLVD